MSAINDIQGLSEEVRAVTEPLRNLLLGESSPLDEDTRHKVDELFDEIETLNANIQNELDEDWEDRWNDTENGYYGWINTEDETGWVNIENDGDYAFVGDGSDYIYNGDGEYSYCGDCERTADSMFTEEWGYMRTQTTHIPFAPTTEATDTAIRIIPMTGVRWGSELEPRPNGTPWERNGDADGPEDYLIEEPINMNYEAIVEMMQAFGYRPMTEAEAEAYFKAKDNPQLTSLMEGLMAVRDQEVA